MASPVHAVFCALLAAAFCSFIGYALGRRILPRSLACGAAPVLGWAVHAALALPILGGLGFSPMAVMAIAGLSIVLAGGSWWLPVDKRDDGPIPPLLAYAAAAGLALAPAAAILPKFSRAGVHLADPIFDHAKIAIVDAMARQGLPPVNPVFGPPGAPNHVAYYYLWHFSAAELASALGFSGWEADIGLTWFTAFASLSLMMGLAVWLSGRTGAAYLVVALATAGSLRTVLGWPFDDDLTPFLNDPQGFSGWLFQSAWVPQHLMAAACTVTAMVLLAQYLQRPGILLLLTLALAVAAGFESSTYVGGVTLAIGATAAAPLLYFRTDPARRLRVAAGLAFAALVTAAIVAPFVLDQLAAIAARQVSHPIVVRPFAVLGEMFSPGLRRVLDVPAFWLIELPLEFPAAFAAGGLALVTALYAPLPRPKKTALACLGCLAGGGLVASWLLASTVGDVDDLGLRAILPALLVLIAAAAAAMLRSPRRQAIAALALGGLALSLPEAAGLAGSDFAGQRMRDARVFAAAPDLWAAVRRYAGPADRVANNPLYLQRMTAWPVNISWALLSDRPSCFAGREMALAFAPLPADRREAINRQFIGVFDGNGSQADIHALAAQYDCAVIVVVPQDRIWDSDPFAASTDYRLAESRDDRWRIYARVGKPR